MAAITNVRSRDPRRGQAGVTLVEIMVALLVQSIFVIFVMGLFGQMSSAYRGQSKVAELQTTVQAARETLMPEIAQAGYGIPNGFFLRDDSVNVMPAMSVVNSADPSGTDLIRFYYADPSAQARITDFSDPQRQFALVDFVDNFQVGDVAVIVKPRLVAAPPSTGGSADIAQYDACVVRVTGVIAAINRIEFTGADATYNSGTNDQCVNVQAFVQATITSSDAMLYRFVGRSYRIDPARKNLSVLQMSPSGELMGNDWVDMGLGFTDLQIATRWFSENGTVDFDGDGDPERNWFSSNNQQTPDPTATRPADSVILQVAVSVAVRTSNEVTTVPTAEAPGFIGVNVNNNRLGDRPAFTLAGVPDGARPPEHQGDHIYRFTSSTIDARNLGVGR